MADHYDTSFWAKKVAGVQSDPLAISSAPPIVPPSVPPTQNLRGLPKSYQRFEEPKKHSLTDRAAAAIMLTGEIPRHVVETVVEPWKQLPEKMEEAKKGKYDLEYWAGRVLDAMIGGAPGGPPLGSAAGMVRKSGSKGPAIRKMMADEWKRRGKPVKYDLTDEILAPNYIGRMRKGERPVSEANVKELIDSTVRGLWFHGRRTYPKAGETFAQSRFKTGNLGEPLGMSLSADPRVTIAKGFAKERPRVDKAINALVKARNVELKKIQAKFPELSFNDIPDSPIIKTLNRKLDQLSDMARAPARVFPRFNAPPSEVILPAWKGVGTEYAQEILKGAYVKGLKLQPKLWQEAGPSRILREDWRSLIDHTALNESIREELVHQGYKGLLYSPARYGEYELRMLDPKDVLMLDIRKPSDPALERLYQSSQTISTPPKGVAKFPPGRQKKRLESWKKETLGSPSSLGDIYADIDLRALTFEGEGFKNIKPGSPAFGLKPVELPDMTK